MRKYRNILEAFISIQRTGGNDTAVVRGVTGNTTTYNKNSKSPQERENYQKARAAVKRRELRAKLGGTPDPENNLARATSGQKSEIQPYYSGRIVTGAPSSNTKASQRPKYIQDPRFKEGEDR